MMSILLSMYLQFIHFPFPQVVFCLRRVKRWGASVQAASNANGVGLKAGRHFPFEFIGKLIAAAAGK
jgi:hypothetical protein